MTRTPETSTEIAIIGGGLIGCMIACELAGRGHSVIVLERGRIGGESSGVSFGSLRLQGHHGATLDLALASQELWRGVEAELGESVEFDPSGHVHLALDDEQEARLDRNAEALRSRGQPVERLDRAALCARWPFLGPKVRAASVSYNDALLNPRLVAPAFARLARRRGARILEGLGVCGAERNGAGFLIRTESPGAGPVRAEILVNAAGAWADRIAAPFGDRIPLFAAGPAEIVSEPVPFLAAPVFHVVDGSILFRRTSRGNLVIGGHPRMAIDRDRRVARVDPGKIVTNLGRVLDVVPALAAYHVIRSWTGIEGYIADMTPVLGPSLSVPGLFHACAFSGHGLQVGPAVARALAGMICDGRTDLPVTGLGLDRFAAASVSAVETLGEEFLAGVVPAAPPQRTSDQPADDRNPRLT